jgi:hypothetical protein
MTHGVSSARRFASDCGPYTTLSAEKHPAVKRLRYPEGTSNVYSYFESRGGVYRTLDEKLVDSSDNILQTVYENGRVVKDWKLEEIRSRVREGDLRPKDECDKLQLVEACPSGEWHSGS